nr:MAG TPA: hypothetical protein [Caudoviricetes sp.]
MGAHRSRFALTHLYSLASVARTCGGLFVIVFIKYNNIQLIYTNLLTLKRNNAIM